MTPKIEVVNGSFSYNHRDTIWENVSLQVNALPMLIFASLGGLALLFSLWLKAMDKRNGYGLELPNIKE